VWRTAQIWWDGEEILVPASGWFPEEQVNSRNPIVSLVRGLLPSVAFPSHSTRLKNLTFCHTIKWIWRINWIGTVLYFSTENLKPNLNLELLWKRRTTSTGVFKRVQIFVRNKREEIWMYFYANELQCQLIKTEVLWLLFPIHPDRSTEGLLKISQNIRVTI
jgi:hypothetical protein